MVEDRTKLTLDEIGEINRLLIKNEILNIIYLRVSTKDKGQQESDQLPEVLKCFELDKKDCFIIIAKESAYKEYAQPHRRINVLNDIFEKFAGTKIKLFAWDLDRFYRRKKLQINFIRNCYENKCLVLTFRQKMLYDIRNLPKIGDVIYDFIIGVLAWLAEEESEKKGDRWLKSLTYDKENDRYYTNKNNLVGRKMKTLDGTLIKDITIINKIKNGVQKALKNNITYDKIIELAAKKMNVKLSRGYIWKIKEQMKKERTERV